MPESRGRQKQRQRRRPYVPKPAPKRRRASPRWFGLMVLGAMAVGVAVIVLNYMQLMPGTDLGPKNLWLFGGLGLIAVGFGLATQWR